jgi:hypothetical protein
MASAMQHVIVQPRDGGYPPGSCRGWKVSEDKRSGLPRRTERGMLCSWPKPQSRTPNPYPQRPSSYDDRAGDEAQVGPFNASFNSACRRTCASTYVGLDRCCLHYRCRNAPHQIHDHVPVEQNPGRQRRCRLLNRLSKGDQVRLRCANCSAHFAVEDVLEMTVRVVDGINRIAVVGGQVFGLWRLIAKGFVRFIVFCIRRPRRPPPGRRRRRDRAR